MKIGSWNVNRRVGQTAVSQGEFLKQQDISIVAIQEANANSLEQLCRAAEFDWWRCALDLRPPQDGDGANRRLGAAVAGRGAPPLSVSVLTNVPAPERTLICDFGDHLVGSFHAPPGVTWGIAKARQGVAVADWLAAVDRPCWFGIDANTPEIDHPDFNQTRTHWHTGMRNLNGERGDDLLLGPNKIHEFQDAFRIYLAGAHEERDKIHQLRPQGPLAISHRTGKRKHSPGNPRRYDSIWVTEDYQVGHVQYLYDESVRTGSDHALVVAELLGD